MEDVAFRVLAAGNMPDFRTISDSRKLHLEALKGLFEQVLGIAVAAKLVKLGRVALGFGRAGLQLNTMATALLPSRAVLQGHSRPEASVRESRGPVPARIHAVWSSAVKVIDSC